MPPNVPHHARWLAWLLTDGGGRIVGGLVAIGDTIAGDEPTLTGDHPAVDAGPAIVLFQAENS